MAVYDSVNIDVQVGVGADQKITSYTIANNTKLIALKNEIANDNNKDISQLNLIFMGKKIAHNESSLILSDIGITNGSRLICIFSSGKKPENMTQTEKSRDEKLMAIGQTNSADPPAEHKIVLSCRFDSRPFGFAVWANAQGKNAIVTKVAGANALSLGIQIGYVVYTCNDEPVFGRPHDEVLELLKTTKCPLKLEFADLGEEYTCSFTAKPLGFTVIQDREENNAKVSKINTRAAQNLGVLIGSYVVGVNNVSVFGKKHKSIIAEINRAQFPINIRFRHPPPLLMLAPRQRRQRKKGR